MFKTSNKRGYIGTWMIQDNKLVLTSLQPDPEENIDYAIEKLFKKGPPIVADWFSGKLIILKERQWDMKDSLQYLKELKN